MGKIRTMTIVIMVVIILLFITLGYSITNNLYFVNTDLFVYSLIGAIVLVVLIFAILEYQVERIRLILKEKELLQQEQEYKRKCDWMEQELKWKEKELELKEKWDRYEREARNNDKETELDRKIRENKEIINVAWMY